MFFQILERDAKKWFSNLLINSIENTSWQKKFIAIENTSWQNKIHNN